MITLEIPTFKLPERCRKLLDEASLTDKLDEQIAAYVEAKEVFEIEVGCGTLETAYVYLKLGDCYLNRDEPEDDDNCSDAEEAISLFKRALSIYIREFGPADPQLLPVMACLIAGYTQYGKERPAGLLFERYLAIADRPGKDTSPTGTGESATTDG